MTLHYFFLVKMAKWEEALLSKDAQALILQAQPFVRIPEYFPDPSAIRLVEVSQSAFSEAAAGSSILLGIIISGTGTFKNK